MKDEFNFLFAKKIFSLLKLNVRADHDATRLSARVLSSF